jgi:L-alanine-DL-glutamate epimerase-like enolase superfamily enzyme
VSTGALGPLGALPLRVERVRCAGLRAVVGSDFSRVSTDVVLEGGGEEGHGEDVTYEADEQAELPAVLAGVPLAGEWTLSTFCVHVEGLELWPRPPARPLSRPYRTWALEAAALDLALRQAGRSLAEALGRAPRPVRFVVSLRLADPPTAAPVLERLARDPGLRFKLDATSAWPPVLFAELAETGAVEAIDLKGAYPGSSVDQPADPILYRRVVEAFPDAWLEDPRVTPDTAPLLGRHLERIAWDGPVGAVEDLARLPVPPRMVNVKPARLGSLGRLLALYAHCERRGIGTYGGGLFELGPGRAQLHRLAALFHPDAPNDVAPVAHLLAAPPAQLPGSPLHAPDGPGFS